MKLFRGDAAERQRGVKIKYEALQGRCPASWRGRGVSMLSLMPFGGDPSWCTGDEAIPLILINLFHKLLSLCEILKNGKKVS
jgi:hypothetical protein